MNNKILNLKEIDMQLSLDSIHLKCESSALLYSGKTLEISEKMWEIKQNKKYQNYIDK